VTSSEEEEASQSPTGVLRGGEEHDPVRILVYEGCSCSRQNRFDGSLQAGQFTGK
jgi:hypothetical protein